MRFFFEVDTGDTVNFWIAPDNPLAVPRVAIEIDGCRHGEMAANFVDEGIRRGGRHATGECRFVITESDIPGLAALPDVAFYDLDTNVLVYRRMPQDGLAPLRLMLVSTGIHPEGVLQSALFRHFHYVCLNLHQLSDEIVGSVFASPYASMLLAGRILVPRNSMHFISADEMLSAILVRDPHVEMATRMIWLRVQALGDARGNWRLGRLREAAAFALDYDYADPKSLKRFFWMLPEPAYHLLYNPLTRQLGTSLPDDRVLPATSMLAMEQLSRFDVVGHRDAYEAFVLSLCDRLGIVEPVPEPEPISTEVAALAERLRRVKEVEEMLVYDVALSDAVLSSITKSWKR